MADCFGVTIDELMDYKLKVLTYKERFVKFMVSNGVLDFRDVRLKSGAQTHFWLNFENFTTNAQIAQIGKFFADCIRENNIEFDTIMGLAYHGIAFSAATACALFQKYGVVVNYCHDRKVPDSRGRILYGYTLQDGDRVVIADRMVQQDAEGLIGSRLIEEKYHTKLYSIITEEDIDHAIQSHIV